MKRIFDILLAAGFLSILFLPLVIVAIVIKLSSPGPALYWSDRMGRYNKLFKMPKFRTMHQNAPTVATHLLATPERYMTGIGGFLRKTSLDELPQLWSILIGDMSIVGPRPALFNQHDLIQLRTEQGVHLLAPGLTGWAQINGRDTLSIKEKVKFDAEYAKKKSFIFDLKIIVWTFSRVIERDGIKH